MSYLDLADRVSLFRSLFAIDTELAARVRERGCPHCGGPLYAAAYERKPRGHSIEVPDGCRLRLGLCCGHCRRRTLPPSVLYWGRRVYWGCVVILVTGAIQGLESHTMQSLCERFGVARRTIKRWLSFFAVLFPQSESWLRVRGRISPMVSSGSLPRALLAWFFGRQQGDVKALVDCLRLLLGAEATA